MRFPVTKLSSLTLALALFAAAFLSGCAHKAFNPASLKTIERPAVFVRAKSEPILELSEADAAHEKRLRARLNAFQMSERLRSAIVHHLPPVEPWINIMPSVEVSTALDRLLVQDTAEEPRYELLKQHGSNTVLEVFIDASGLRYNPKTKKTGFFLEGSARLFHIDGDTLWKAPFSMDSTLLADFPGLIPGELSHDGYFDSLNDFLFRLTQTAMSELSGGLPTEQNYEGRDDPLSQNPSADGSKVTSGTSAEDDEDMD